MKSSHAILVVGSMAFDDLEFPLPMPDPAVPGGRAHKFLDVIGGSATYVALAAAPYAAVRLVAVIGDDFPESMLTALRDRAVDTSGIERVAGRTFRWSGRYHDDMVARDTLDTQLNVFADFRPKIPAAYRDSGLVMLGNIHPELQLEVLDQVDKPRLVLADTMNFWIRGEGAALAKLLERVDLLLLNDEEARMLSGKHNLARAAADILKRGPSRLIIKRGEHGSLYFDEHGVFAAPALLLDEVVDPTGAGDSFAGGLIGYLAQAPSLDHATMRRAMVHGTAVASCCVEAVGPGALLKLDVAMVRRRVERFRELITVELAMLERPS